MKISYEMKLLTPAITANSGTIGKDIDVVTKVDRDGNPYVPASHLKGILRERTEEFGRALNISTSIFGEEGKAPSKIRFSNLSLRVEDSVELESRHGIRMNRKTRTTEENSLFSYEMIPTTTSFIGELEIVKKIQEEELKLLIASLFHLNKIGGLKSRGLGKVAVSVEGKSLKDLDSILKQLKSKEHKKENLKNTDKTLKKFSYRLVLEENLILKGKENGNQIEVRDSIQGSTLRGAVIGKLSEVGISLDELLNISVSAPISEVEGVKLASLFKTKYPTHGDKHSYVDKVFYSENEVDKIKLERGSLSVLKDKTEDIGIEIDSKTKTAKEGKIFNSEILLMNNSNNMFIGEISLTSEMAKYLNGKELFLGKKKLKGFGKAKLHIEELKGSKTNSLKSRIEHSKFKNLVTFTAISDIVLPFNEVYDICEQFLDLVEIDRSELTPCKKRSFINLETLSGYSILNNSRKSDEIIIKSGTVFTYEGNGTSVLSKLEKVENHGVGIRKSEGFGKVEICSERHLAGEVK